MALRFVLVSAVASLGLSFPEAKDVQGWTCGAERWVSARLAGWDHHDEEEGADVVSAEQCDLSGPGESASGDVAFDVVMEETVRSFSADRPAAPAREEQVMVQAAPAFEPMVIGEDLYTGTAYALNRASEGTDLSRLGVGERTAAADTESMAVTAGSFEPMVVGDDLYVGVAYSLNRASEGLDLASESPTMQAPAVASPASQLSVALRLTREAVYAWSNLLHGPAVVAISR